MNELTLSSAATPTGTPVPSGSQCGQRQPAGTR